MYANLRKDCIVTAHGRNFSTYECALTLFFYKNNFIRTKALILAKKVKNKRRAKPG